MSKIHLVIFCKESYKDFLPYCSYSAETFIEDEIVTKTIVSEKFFKYKDYETITDQNLWEIIDSDKKHYNLYNTSIFHSGWIKQQIMKLSVNDILDGDVLILDADLVFLRPIKFIENNKYNFYFANEYDERYFVMMKHILGLEKQTEKYQSFISDFCLFNTNILCELKTKIKMKYKKSWLEVIENYISNSNILPIMSEYEIYGNYFFKYHRKKINRTVDPIDYKMRIDFPHYKNYSPKELIEKIKSDNKNYYQCINLNKSSFIKYV